jgi:hypothetical protein
MGESDSAGAGFCNGFNLAEEDPTERILDDMFLVGGF